jgi:hypothetical protein
MPNGGYREEVLNVLLAQLLADRGLVTTPESAVRSAEDARRLPDVLVVFQGLRLVVEGKYDDAQASTAVLTQATERVEQGVAHIGVAVLYPRRLAHVPFDDLPAELAASELSIAICTEDGSHGWTQGDLDYLGDLLRRAFEEIIEEDVVAAAVEALEAGVADFSRTALRLPGAVSRLADVLGIAGPP